MEIGRWEQENKIREMSMTQFLLIRAHRYRESDIDKEQHPRQILIMQLRGVPNLWNLMPEDLRRS